MAKRKQRPGCSNYLLQREWVDEVYFSYLPPEHGARGSRGTGSVWEIALRYIRPTGAWWTLIQLGDMDIATTLEHDNVVGAIRRRFKLGLPIGERSDDVDMAETLKYLSALTNKYV